MLCTQKYRVGVVGGMSVAVSLLLILVLAGCGGEEKKSVAVRTTSKADYNGDVTATFPQEIKTVPASGEEIVIERAVAIQEPVTPVVTYEEAEAALLEAERGLAQKFGATSPQIRKALQALASLYELWDKPEIRGISSQNPSRELGPAGYPMSAR